MESNQTNLSNYHNKKSPIAMKKVALKDVQNNNRSDSLNYSEKSWSLGLPTVGESKVVGIKRPNPVCSPNLPCPQLLTESEVNDHLLNGGSKVDKEMAKRKIKRHSNISCVPVVASLPTASLVTFSPGRPSVSHFLEKPGNSIGALDSNHLKITPGSDVPNFLSSDNDSDQQRMGRLHQLHNLLKYYDEFDRREYVHVLRGLSPLDLSRHAVELEKRSIHLCFEEGNKSTLKRERDTTDESTEYIGESSLI